MRYDRIAPAFSIVSPLRTLARVFTRV